VIIRAAVPAEAAAVGAAYLTSWRAGYAGLVDDDVLEQRASERAGHDWFEPGTSTVVADDGTILGCAQVRGDELEMLYVVPSSWGSGVASALLADAVQRGAQRLKVVEAQARARRFYEREGWVPDEVAPDSNGLFRLLWYRCGP
jgi:GNAT superfamily N-acetyltransferase